MPYDESGNWYPSETTIDTALRKAMEIQQAEGVLESRLTSIGEQVGKLELLQRRGDNWFAFRNSATGTHWILDANPTSGLNHWIVTRTTWHP
jgi:hypothetical protein